MNRCVPFVVGQSREQRFDPRRVEHGCRLTNAHTGRCQSNVHPTTIRSVAGADDVALAFQSIDRQRHRCRRHSHVPRKIVHGRGIEFIEMVEDARLVTAEKPLRLGIADVPRVTGEIDLRIEREHLPNGFNGRVHFSRENIHCFAKIK